MVNLPPPEVDLRPPVLNLRPPMLYLRPHVVNFRPPVLDLRPPGLLGRGLGDYWENIRMLRGRVINFDRFMVDGLWSVVQSVEFRVVTRT